MQRWMKPTYVQLKATILKGLPDHKNQLPEALRQYWQVCRELSIEDDVTLCACRLLIPIAKHKTIMAHLHLAHQGITRTKQRAWLTLYWPEMDNDIENIVTSCTQCQDHLPPNHKEPLPAKPRSVQPFQEAAADFCYHVGRSYLVWVDCYSDWPIIAPMDRGTTASHLIAVCPEIFGQTAVPGVL